MKRFAAIVLLLPSLVWAQDDEPPKPWTTSIGAGLALTSGNRETDSLNVSFSTEYDFKTVHVFKSEILYLRGSVDGERTVDRSAASARYERTIRQRAFGFGETTYLRDPFRNLTYSVSPVAGVGYHLVRTDSAQLTLDGAFGVTVERDDVRGRRQYRTWKGGEMFEWSLSPATKLTQKLTALWNRQDFGDALYQLESALATTLAGSLELKVSYRYDHKTRPPLATLKKGDSALFAALVYKVSR
ncbi:MAG TPA: DUF481 domain-containing protein [Thermoanaerobaculia bacterium]|nr:DUF481 domain-containing protein [Thermoanaerobaculia bacterium]